MTFWNAPSGSGPKRQYRFLIQNGAKGDAVWWWAKSAQLPSYQINEEVYKLGNHHYKYPGTVTWNDVQITIVDTGDKMEKLYNSLKSGGYYPDASGNDGLGGGNLAEELTEGGDFQIVVLKDDGKTSDTWVLKKPWIKQASFGQLDYSSDDLINIELTICYDRAKRE